jgi:single-strand DNA-binding protein
MPNLNKVLLMGNLTRDPELRYLPSGMAVVNLGLAVNRRWRNQQGEQQEETTFVDLEAYGKPAETMNQFLKKGRPVFIEGRLRLDQWQDKEGNSRSKLKVVVDTFQFIDSGMGGRDGAGGGGSSGGASSGGGGDYAGGSDQDHSGGGGGGNYDQGQSQPPRRPQPPRNAPPARSAAAPPPPAAQDPHKPVDEEDIPF